MRKPVVGVMGGSAVNARVERTAFDLGRMIAENGWVLLNGGRNSGVMAASARGAKEAGGLVVGILPGRDTSGAAPDLDVAVVTGVGDARNLINVLSADVVIALSGGAGTLCEVALALKNNKRLILLGFADSPAFAEHRRSGQLSIAGTVAEAITQAAEALGQSP